MSATEREVAKYISQSDYDVWNATRREAHKFRDSKGKHELGLYGLTKGNYWQMDGKHCKNCAGKLRSLCKYNPSNMSYPPGELMIPGRLSRRPRLRERNLCFLWYANNFWTRATGGIRGRLMWRLGAGIDDKAFLVQALLRYAAKNKCTPWTGYPVTLELNKTETCGEFFRNNAQWARKPDQLWFMKAIDGSTGRHINLMRRNDIEALHAAGDFACPMNGSIASLEVPGMWTPRGKKFDNRVYMLIPSIHPLTALFRVGHLRFSVFNYTERFESTFALNRTGRASKWVDKIKANNATWMPEMDHDLGIHVTNPRFGMAHTNDTNDVIKPVTYLEQVLVQERGEHAGKVAFEKLQRSVRNAALQVLYAVRQKWLQKNPKTMGKWGFAMIAMDVAYDTNMNAYVLDLNSGPSFYHDQDWPAWFVRERSAIIREGFDIVQEAMFRKFSNYTHPNGLPFKHNGGWEMLYQQDYGGVVKNRGLLGHGECLKPYDVPP